MAIPGLKKPDHIGFTVPNLQEAVAFFRDHFEFELAYEFGPFASDDNWMADHLNVNPRAKIDKIAVMSAKGINLEIFEYADTVERNKKHQTMRISVAIIWPFTSMISMLQ
ncbi:hypothetical protein JCM19233_6857 [Vibrio astriarenae]|nr:hypothetical protein JCM19233_6857 [Vibrio sp. C7]